MILISRYTTLRFLLVQSVFPLSCCFFEFQITIFSQIYFILVDKDARFVVIIVNEEERGFWEAVCLLASGIAEDKEGEYLFLNVKTYNNPSKNSCFAIY